MKQSDHARQDRNDARPRRTFEQFLSRDQIAHSHCPKEKGTYCETELDLAAERQPRRSPGLTYNNGVRNSRKGKPVDQKHPNDSERPQSVGNEPKKSENGKMPFELQVRGTSPGRTNTRGKGSTARSAIPCIASCVRTALVTVQFAPLKTACTNNTLLYRNWFRK